MAPGKTKSNEPATAQEKIARVLGLLAVKGIEQRTEQAALLRAVGFEVSEVAAMLGMTENHVNVAAHMGRKTRGEKKRPKPTSKTR